MSRVRHIHKTRSKTKTTTIKHIKHVAGRMKGTLHVSWASDALHHESIVTGPGAGGYTDTSWNETTSGVSALGCILGGAFIPPATFTVTGNIQTVLNRMFPGHTLAEQFRLYTDNGRYNYGTSVSVDTNVGQRTVTEINSWPQFLISEDWVQTKEATDTWS